MFENLKRLFGGKQVEQPTLQQEKSDGQKPQVVRPKTIYRVGINKKERPSQAPVETLPQTRVGVSWSHPLELFKRLQDENAWVDLASRTIAQAVSDATPLFVVSSENDTEKRATEKVTDLLMNPNVDEDGHTMIYNITKDLVDLGNSYIRIIYTVNGQIHSLYRLAPETIYKIPYIDENKILRYKFYQSTPIAKEYKWDEVIHFKLPGNLKSSVYGKPIFYSNITNIIIDENVSDWVQNFFSQSYGGGLIFEQEADEETATRNREMLDTAYSGAHSAGKSLLLEGGIKVHSPPTQMNSFAYDKLKSISKEEILTHADVPVSCAGVRSDLGNSNAEIVASEEKKFLKTITWYQKIIYGTIRHKFFKQILQFEKMKIEAGLNLSFNVKERIDQAKAAGELGARIGELRTLLGLPPLESEAANDVFIMKNNNGYFNAGLQTLTDLSTGKPISDDLIDLANKARGGGNTKPPANGNNPDPK